LRGFLDAALAGRNLGGLLYSAALFLGAALGTQLIAVAETYVAEDLGWTATNRLRADLTLHLLRLDLSFHNRRTPGELIERVAGDVTALANFFSRFILLIVGNAILLVGGLVMLYREDARVGLTMAVYAGVAALVLRRLRASGVAAAAGERQASAALFGFLEERLAALSEVRANAAGDYVMHRLYERMRAVYVYGRHALLRQRLLTLTSAGLWALGYAGVLVLGVALFQAGRISLGTVYLFLAYTELLRRPLDQITTQLQDMQKASASSARVQELYGLAPAPAEGPGTPLPPGALAVEFDGVTFGYGDGAPVIEDVSFRLAPGTVLGVVGRTGSGKTTLSRLLLRLYEPRAGAIRLGGVDVRDLRLETLRRHVGVVTQDVQLFRATVRDNLTLFDPRISDRAICDAIHALGLDRWYESLPHGLDTELTADSAGLSAGQAQLVAFARVFLRDPGLVILDEASSRLDPATERLIERAVDQLLAGRTAILIAHRLASVARADEILVLDRGRIREQGRRGLLAGDPHSCFAHLLRTALEEVPV
jgi:ABC-type multidrug transport system fused ATPase/permease subunit